ncbi:HAD hydrolase-like protein [Selenomonas sp.]|uniref:HAD hydrolase-like protein n=1 Tax=Selenomonas sp. TaxID=2053611 RepID=UPI0025F9152F|nr:HAD hydrolase-like protein [Selenomonas sp.]
MFAHCFISEQVGVQKPDPRFFEPCFETLRADGLDMRPDETILIGDSLTSDVAGGKRYGMKTCWYRKKAAPVPEDACQTTSLTAWHRCKNFYMA